MKVVAVSDIHCRFFKTPPCDLLIVAGDVTTQGTREQVKWFAWWLKQQPATHKVYIAGNHDKLFATDGQQAAEIMAECGAHYLQDSSIVINGLVIYGSPWTPKHGDWPFMHAPESKQLRKIWKKIPKNVDILVTHGPPRDILDLANKGGAQGCPLLRKRVLKVKPRVHVFGHIHEGRGTTEYDGIKFMNVTVCNRWNDLVYEPTVFDMEAKDP